MKYDFIEIGTSDFDTLIQSTEGQIGLSIEPLKIYLDRLPSNKTVIKVNCAVSDRNGVTHVYWVDPHDIDKYDLPLYLKGCNSIENPHPTTLRILNERNLESLLKKETCETITWNRLVNRYNIDSITLLKIDTEGHDCVIINNILNSECKVLPKKIWFESNELSNQKLLNRTLKRLDIFGYKVTFNDNLDTICEMV